jgi:hypothetical protein
MRVNKVKIDLRDLKLFNSRRWFYTGLPGNEYWVDNQSNRLHRLIMRPAEGMVVDHINGDKHDNRRCNLRVCTQHQNNYNARKRRDGLSRWKGVYPVNNTTSKVWAAHIRADKRRSYLGCFEEEACAATAFNFAAAELHGEFAVYNTVPQPWLESL